MMDRLREGVNSIAVKIILGLIICSFVFAGIGSYLVSGGNNTAATVGKTEISRNQFEQAYQNERNRMQSQAGDYFNQLLGDPAYVESFRKSVLDRMINDLLLEQHAEALGLRISDAQIRTMILEMPQFQKDGKFDQAIYEATLRRAGYSADSFAHYLRTDAVRQQLLSAVQGSEFSLKNEIEQQSKLLTQTRDIRTLTLSVADFAKNVKLTDDEISAFYKQHTSEYTRPEQYKISYIELSAQQLKDQMKPSKKAIQQYYDEHLDKYSTKEQRQVRHILVQGNDKAKAQAILDELNAGADFATLAKQKSEDVGSADKGGELGWIERDVMDPEFEKAVFSMKKAGETSGLVKSAFGYHIIQLEAIKAPQAKPLAEVKADVVQNIVDQSAVDKFYDLQTKLEKVAFESPDSLDESAKVIGKKVQTTDFVSQSDVPALLNKPEVQQALQSDDVKESGLNSSVIEVSPEHVIVVRIDDSRPAKVLPLEEVKAQVTARLAQTKGQQHALALASKMVTALNKGDDALVKEHHLNFSEPQTVDRRSALAHQVFALPKPSADKPVFGQSKDAQGNIVIVELTKVTAKADPQYNAPISEQIAKDNVQKDLSAMLQVLRKNTDIEYHIVKQ